MSRTKEAWWSDGDGWNEADFDLLPEHEFAEPSFIAMTRSIPEHLALELEWLSAVSPFHSDNERDFVRTFLVQPPSHRLSGVIRSLDARVAA
jgi:hypothetical protein